MMPLQAKNAQAFTLIELIAIVVLLSVLSVVAFGRLGDLSGFSRKASFDEVVAAVQYAQKLAVSTGCSVQVVLVSDGYNLHQGNPDCDDTVYARNVVHPRDRVSPYEKVNDPDISISPGATFVFTSQSSVTGLTTDQVFVVNGRQFQIFRSTGLVNEL